MTQSKISINESKRKTIVVKCPKCGEKLTVTVGTGFSGIRRISIIHGTPRHALILYIDNRGFIRGFQVIEEIHEIEELPLKDIITIIGEEAIAALLYFEISDKKFSPVIGDSAVFNVLNALIRDLNIKGMVFSSDAIIFNPLNPSKLGLELQPLTTIVKTGVEKCKMYSDFVSWLKENIIRLKNAIKELEKIVKTSIPVNGRKLCKQLNITKDELSLLLSILRKKGLDISKIVFRDFIVSEVFG